MRNIIGFAVLVAIGAYVFFGDSSSSASADLGKVLDRTEVSLRSFQDHLTKQGVSQVSNEHMTQLTGFMQQALNTEPAIHTQPIGVQLLKDSTFEGFADANRDNVKDSGEDRLFTVEIDFDGKRLIATGVNGTSTGMGMGTGLLAGMLMGHLLSSQRAAGVQQGHFANRNVQSRDAYARSQARSGGRFSGK